MFPIVVVFFTILLFLVVFVVLILTFPYDLCNGLYYKGAPGT
jgi:hypothetical protein